VHGESSKDWKTSFSFAISFGIILIESREQRCWVHKLASVLDKLPKRLQPRAKDSLYEIFYAPDGESAKEAIESFTDE
jgi:transposase-like protein